MAFALEQFRGDGKITIATGVGGRGNPIVQVCALGLANAGAAVGVAGGRVLSS